MRDRLHLAWHLAVFGTRPDRARRQVPLPTLIAIAGLQSGCAQLQERSELPVESALQVQELTELDDTSTHRSRTTRTSQDFICFAKAPSIRDATAECEASPDVPWTCRPTYGTTIRPGCTWSRNSSRPPIAVCGFVCWSMTWMPVESWPRRSRCAPEHLGAPVQSVRIPARNDGVHR